MSFCPVTKAIVLHDAEDVVHPAELRVFDRLSERFDLVQLPVLPLVDENSRWIAGHYCDEFSEAHGRTLIVREALGAGVPSAGVGCAIARPMLARIAAARAGMPFDDGSVTEDYELGLRIRALGGRGIFVRLPAVRHGSPVAVRAYFPATFEAAVRQKARWMTGIALSGWDRLGWQGGLAESWMRLRDRRAVLANIVLASAYAAMVGYALLWLASLPAGWPLAVDPLVDALCAANFVLLAWRAAIRMAIVARSYGWREGLRALPRLVVGNIIGMAAARRAVQGYLGLGRGERPAWDKTAHHFPADLPGQ